MVDREDAIELGEGEYFLYDAIGCRVVSDEGAEIGEIKDVLETGANPVFVIKTDAGKEVLFPVIDECILSVDTEKMEAVAHVMPGLMD